MKGKFALVLKAYSFLLRWYWPMLIVTLVIFVAIGSITTPDTRMSVWVAAFLLVAAPQSIILFLGSRERAKEFSAPPGSAVRFSETNVSGYTNLSRMSSFLMVKRSLVVEVTDDTVYIRPKHAGRGDLYKEFQRVAIKDITQAEKVGHNVRFKWSGETSGDFTLILSNADAFMAAIHRTSLGTPLAPVGQGN